VKALLDTHAFLWWTLGDTRLSAAARAFIADPSNGLLFSVASGWELAIKVQAGRLDEVRPLGDFLTDHLARYSIAVLPVLLPHVLAVLKLPNHHKDPFDRILVAQSLVENISIVSGDPAMARYDVERIW